VLEAAARYIATRCSSSTSSDSSSSSGAAATVSDDVLSTADIAAVCNELCSGSSTSSSATSTPTGKTSSSGSRGSAVKRRRKSDTTSSSNSGSSSSSTASSTATAGTRAERFLPLVLASIAQYDMTVVSSDVQAVELQGTVEVERTVKKHPIVGFPPNLWQALQDGVFWCRVVLEEAEHGRNGAWMQVTVKP
jgi:hypothetical protein